jgi:(E)-4-hydroxy-3-methylbut-2-enyl-diphosphate synthase
MPKLRRFAALSALLALSAAPAAHAYSEDVCVFHVANGSAVDPDHVYAYPFNCYDLQCLDGPGPSSSGPRCAVSGLMQYLAVTMAPAANGTPRFDGHSALHFDVLFTLARIAGLGHDEALRLATWGESVDLGAYRPVASIDRAQTPNIGTLGVGSSEENINGLTRDNVKTNGFWLHYVPWLADGSHASHTVTVAGYKAYLANPANTDFDELERPLTHVRDWALASGGARPLCTLGFTNADGTCASGGVYVYAAMLGDAIYNEGVTPLGVQPAHQLADGSYDLAAGQALSGTVEALGVYLHVLGDRLSHDLCLRDTPIRPATGSSQTCDGELAWQYELRFTDACGQASHTVRHYLETGHGDATPSRTINGINLAARELALWSTSHQLTPAPPRAGLPAFLANGKVNEAFIRRLIGTAERPGLLPQAIGEPCANRRAERLCALARDGYGIGWYDGNTDCRYLSFPGDTSCASPTPSELGAGAPRRPTECRTSRGCYHAGDRPRTRVPPPIPPMTQRVRHQTVGVRVGRVQVGGGAPVVVQSMANTDTADPVSTARQCIELAQAGSDMVRITVNIPEAAAAVPEIKRRMLDAGVEAPLIGDFHYNGHVLLTQHPDCARALDKYRINPGNVGKGRRRDEQFATIVKVAADHGKPVRIGVNGGSLDQELVMARMQENTDRDLGLSAEEIYDECMVLSALQSTAAALENGLREDQVIISCKVSRPNNLIAVYRALARQTHQPLHLGLTEAGMGIKGLVWSAAAMGVLLDEGIGDTIRVSLTPRPGGDRREEVYAACELLQSLGIRSFAPSVTACPGCGRTTSTTFQQLAEHVQGYLRDQLPRWKQEYEGVETMTLAVMGCVVNGPGESKAANIGISLPGTGEAPTCPVYIDGQHFTTLRGNYEELYAGFRAIVDDYVDKSYARREPAAV